MNTKDLINAIAIAIESLESVIDRCYDTYVDDAKDTVLELRKTLYAATYGEHDLFKVSVTIKNVRQDIIEPLRFNTFVNFDTIMKIDKAISKCIGTGIYDLMNDDSFEAIKNELITIMNGLDDDNECKAIRSVYVSFSEKYDCVQFYQFK